MFQFVHNLVSANFFIGKYYVNEVPSTYSRRNKIKLNPGGARRPDLQAFCWRYVIVSFHECLSRTWSHLPPSAFPRQVCVNYTCLHYCIRGRRGLGTNLSSLLNRAPPQKGCREALHISIFLSVLVLLRLSTAVSWAGVRMLLDRRARVQHEITQSLFLTVR